MTDKPHVDHHSKDYPAHKGEPPHRHVGEHPPFTQDESKEPESSRNIWTAIVMVILIATALAVFAFAGFFK